MSDYNKILTLTAQKQWEITKGHLRASVSIVGATYGPEPHSPVDKYLDFENKVDSFIKDIEGNDLQYP